MPAKEINAFTASEMENMTLDENPKSEHLTPRVVDRALEKRLVWKLDTRVLPILTIMYLFKCVSVLK